jgi:hypothetical protein
MENTNDKIEVKACAAPVCSACGGLSMIEGSRPDDDVMNTQCPECNPWTGLDAHSRRVAREWSRLLASGKIYETTPELRDSLTLLAGEFSKPNTLGLASPAGSDNPKL